MSERIFTVEVAASKVGWTPLCHLMQGQTAYISATGQWGVIDPPTRGVCGPTGNGVPASGYFVLRGAPEGCLVIGRFIGGPGVPSMRWQKVAYNGSEIVMNVPGEIAAIANDANSYESDEPNHSGRGYDDNTGSIQVTVRIVS